MALKTYYVEGDLPCAIREHDRLGHLCGYVGVPACHPWYGMHCDGISAEVHGGLTFAHHELLGHPAEIARLKREIADPDCILRESYERQLAREESGEGDPYPCETGLDIWWVGFDCAHGWDICPKANLICNDGATYKDEPYVRQEITQLVEQAALAMREEGL